MFLDQDCINLVIKKVGRWTSEICKYVSKKWYVSAITKCYNPYREQFVNMMLFASSTNNLDLVKFVQSERSKQFTARRKRDVRPGDWLWTDGIAVRDSNKALYVALQHNCRDIFRYLFTHGYSISMGVVDVLVEREETEQLDLIFNEIPVDWFPIIIMGTIRINSLKCLNLFITKCPSAFSKDHVMSAIRQDNISALMRIKSIVEWPAYACEMAATYNSIKCLRYMLMSRVPFNYDECVNSTDCAQCKVLLHTALINLS